MRGKPARTAHAVGSTIEKISVFHKTNQMRWFDGAGKTNALRTLYL